MHIDSGIMILNSNRFDKIKQAQELSVVETPDTLTDRELTRALRDAICAEEGAIKQYETVVDATDNEDVKKVLQSIADEEKIHVGELQKLLSDLLSDEQGFLDDGVKEVEDQLGGDAEIEVDVEEDTEDTEDTEE